MYRKHPDNRTRSSGSDGKEGRALGSFTAGLTPPHLQASWAISLFARPEASLLPAPGEGGLDPSLRNSSLDQRVSDTPKNDSRPIIGTCLAPGQALEPSAAGYPPGGKTPTQAGPWKKTREHRTKLYNGYWESQC